MWLVFRWNYSVKDIYGPFLTEEEAIKKREELLEDIEGRLPGDYSIHHINHVQPLISRKELQEILIEVEGGRVGVESVSKINWAFEILARRMGIPS